MIALFAILGKSKSLLDIVSVNELIGIIFIFSGITFLGIIQHREAKDKGLKESFKSGATALIFPVLFSLMDGLETIVTGICLDRTHGFAMPTDDSVIIVGMEYAIIAFGFWIYVSVKEKHLFNPVSKKNLPFISGALCDNVAIVFYANAMSINAVATDPILAIYPAVTMVLSRIFLKEKLSIKQYLSLILLLVGSIVIVIGENDLF